MLGETIVANWQEKKTRPPTPSEPPFFSRICFQVHLKGPTLKCLQEVSEQFSVYRHLKWQKDLVYLLTTNVEWVLT